MKKKTTEIIFEHFQEHFGKLIAERLIDKKLKQYKITDLENMETNDKIEFSSKVIKDIFGEFYGEKKIDYIHKLFLLRYALNESLDMLGEYVKVDCKLKIGHIEPANLKKTEKFVNAFEKEEAYNITYKVKGYGDAVVVLNVDKDKMIQFCLSIIEMKTGEKSRDFELDEAKQIEFDELRKKITDKVSDSFNVMYKKEIDIKNWSFEDFKERHIDDRSIIGFKALLKTEFEITLGKESFSGIVFFFIEDEDFDGKKTVNQDTEEEKK
jgi:hypothetical protein